MPSTALDVCYGRTSVSVSFKGCVRVLGRNKTNRTYAQRYIREDLLSESAHMVTGTAKFHDTPSASWRTREGGGRIRSKSKGVIIGQLMV